MSNQSPVPQPPASRLDSLVPKSNEQSSEGVEEKNEGIVPEVQKPNVEELDVVIVFDSRSSNYIVGLENHNLQFVQEASQYLNHDLKIRGHLFLNDVHDYLKLPRTPEGQLLGWIHTDDAPARVDIQVIKEGDAFLLTPNLQGLIQPFI